MTGSAASDAAQSGVRERILEAATSLIATGGLAALTTRAVAARAGVQAPTLYRLFGEKRGLLDAVAEYGLAAFIAQKASAAPHPDPVQDLRDAWDAYVAFGLSNPAVFAIMNDIDSARSPSPPAQAGIAILRARIERIARAGRLTMQIEQAVALIHATGVGTVATLLTTPEEKRERQLPAIAREAVLAAVVADLPDQQPGGLAPLAIGLRAHLWAAEELTPGERLLLTELLDKLAQR
ncbi:TetR/AcrR family transcriptional regulator [Acidisoma sp. C75]